MLQTTVPMIILHSNNSHWIDLLTFTLSNRGFRDIIHAGSGGEAVSFPSVSTHALPDFMKANHRLIQLLITDLPIAPAIFPNALWLLCAEWAIPFFAWLPEEDERSSLFLREAGSALPAPFKTYLSTYISADSTSASAFIDHINSINNN